MACQPDMLMNQILLIFNLTNWKAVLSVVAQCEPTHRYTPLVEVNQSDTAWSSRQMLSPSQLYLNYNMTMSFGHDILVPYYSKERGCMILYYMRIVWLINLTCY